MSISNDQTSQEHKLNKVSPGSGLTIEEEAEQAKTWAEARAAAAEQAKIEIQARIEGVKKEEAYLPYEEYIRPGQGLDSFIGKKRWIFRSINGYHHMDGVRSLISAFAIIKSAATAELARAEEARISAEEQAKLYKALYDRLAVMEHKLDQVPKISYVVQLQGSTIDSGIDETKALRRKIYELSDRLDSYERLSNDLSGRQDSCERLSNDLSNRLDFCEGTSKFICSVYSPALLGGQAKEMYGLICPKVGHDEL